MHSITSSWHIYIWSIYCNFFNPIPFNSIIWFLQMLAIKLLLQVMSYIKMYPFYVYNLPVFSWTELRKPILLTLYGHPEIVLWAGRKIFEIVRLTNRDTIAYYNIDVLCMRMLRFEDTSIRSFDHEKSSYTMVHLLRLLRVEHHAKVSKKCIIKV